MPFVAVRSVRIAVLCAAVLFSPLAGGPAPATKTEDRAGRAYYVDSVAGRDSNTATSPSSPWKTLEKVNATTFSPGDKILFKAGSIWTGQLWPKGSGVEGRPIVIDKYGGDAKPIIHGAGQAEDTILLKNQEYWEIQNLEVTNTGRSAAPRRGVHLRAENSGDLHHIHVRSLIIHDVNGVDRVKHNGGLSYTCDGDLRPSRFVDLRIEDNVIYRVDRSGVFGWSTHWMRSKWYPSLGVVIRNNRLDDIGGDGIVNVATDGALVEYNVVRRANQRSKGDNDGIWAWSADHTIIQLNEVYLTHGQRDAKGFDSDWNSRNTIIQYNYSHDNDGGFVLICNDGAERSDSVGNVGTVVRYNISQNDRTASITVSGPVKDASIYNNTIYVGSGDEVALLLSTEWGGWPDGTHLYNNIFYVEGVAQLAAYGFSTPGAVTVSTAGFGESRNNVFDSNVYYGHVGTAPDAHALTTDPMLVSPGRGGAGRQTVSGYRPRHGSPALDSGKALENDGGRDFFGRPVPSCGGVDRGAIEDDDCRR